MFVSHDRLDAVWALEHVAVERVPTVHVASVGAVDQQHASTEVGLGRLEQKVKVVRHQAVGMAQPSEPIDGRGEIAKQRSEVSFVEKDPLPTVATAGDVVEASGPFECGGTHSALSVRLSNAQLGCNFVATELRECNVSRS